MLSQPGLRWVLNRCFEAEPIWTHDPKVKTIIKLARQHLQFRDDEKCTADYYMQGAFNKIYLIRCPRNSKDEKSFVFRVSLPVDPGFKVTSDAATMRFVRNHTDAPVPRVLAFDPSHENELGFAWTIMEMMPGRPLCEQWRYMTREQKEDLVKRVTDIWAQMFRLKFRGIGNIYQMTTPPNETDIHDMSKSPDHVTAISEDSVSAVSGSTQSLSEDEFSEDGHVSTYNVGRIVSMCFVWHKRVNYNVYRGPFKCSFDWLSARLNFVIIEADDILKDPLADPKHKIFAGRYSSTARRLQQQLPKFFPEKYCSRTGETSELTTLHHYDTSGYNVLVDNDGRLTALLDWDGVSAVPLWKACQMPEFLVSTFIDDMWYEDKPDAPDRDWVDQKALRDEAITLEKEQLRAFFLDEMEKIAPQWVQIHKTSAKLADFELAVQFCDSLFKSALVDEWLEHLEQGKEYRSLEEFLNPKK